MLDVPFPLSHMAPFMGSYGNLYVIRGASGKRALLPLLAKCWQTWERVGRTVVAKVCKSLQNLAVANT